MSTETVKKPIVGIIECPLHSIPKEDILLLRAQGCIVFENRNMEQGVRLIELPLLPSESK